MPSDWAEVRLGDVVEEVTVGHVGPMAREYVATGIPFLRSQNVAPHALDMSEVKFITPEFHARLKKSGLKPGDVVTVRTGKPGATAVIPYWLPVANCSDLVITRPGQHVDSRWLSYYINGAAGGFVASRLVGAVQQHFNVGAAKEMSLPLPPLAEQRGIATTLGALDDKIEAIERTNRISEQLAQALYRAWFIELTPWGGVVPADWREGSLSELLTSVKRQIKAGDHPELPYVPIDMMAMRSLGLADFRPNEDAQSSLITFAKNDILIGAMRVYFHRVSIAPFDGITRTTCFVLRPKESAYLEYALLLCNEDSTIQFAEASSKGSTMPYAVWDGGLANMSVLIPTVEVAQKFSELVGPLAMRLRDGLFELRRLHELRDVLLPELLSGRVRVPEAAEVVEEAVA